MEWISVKDKQPDFNIPVLASNVAGGYTPIICRLESVVERKETKVYNWLEGEHGYDDVYKDITHWMPLPDHPFRGSKLPCKP